MKLKLLEFYKDEVLLGRVFRKIEKNEPDKLPAKRAYEILEKCESVLNELDKLDNIQKNILKNKGINSYKEAETKQEQLAEAKNEFENILEKEKKFNIENLLTLEEAQNLNLKVAEIRKMKNLGIIGGVKTNNEKTHK